MKNRLFSALLLSALVLPAAAEPGTATVTINHTVKRYLGDVSELDRSKFFNFHASGYKDEDVLKVSQDYNIGFGRSFWGPFSENNRTSGEPWTGQSMAGNFPANKPDAEQNTEVLPNNDIMKHLVATDHPESRFSCYVDPVEAGRWAVEYYKNYNAYVPSYLEPMNEPFVHADEFWGFKGAINHWPEGTEKPDYLPEEDVMTTTLEVKEHISKIFAEIGRQVHLEPTLANMKVVGYSAAYPAYELRDFSQWDTNMKLFLDIAGDHMDGLSIHLYDGVNITGRSSYRSGSNSEALLDLLEAYTYIRYGDVIPHCGTEYGGIVEDYGYYEETGARSGLKVLPAVSHIMFNYIERQDDVLVTIPFIGEKSEWYINEENNWESYSGSLLMPNDPKDFSKGWYPNKKINLYDIWKDVQGDRVEIRSNEADVQVLAFRSGTRVFFAFDNLEFDKMEVALDFQAGKGNFTNVEERKMSITANGDMDYQTISHGDAMPNTIEMNSEGLTIIAADLIEEDGYPTNVIHRTKYYSSNYLQKIQANNTISFPYQGVDVSTGYGKCYARLSIGTPLPNTNTGYAIVVPPVLKVNGTEVPFVTDWKGYDQEGRDDFFGTLEIPFDISLLKEGDNEITVTYPSTGGHISSMILQVELYDNLPDASSSSVQNGTFDAVTMSDWIPFGQWANIAIESARPLSGSKSLKVDGSGGVFQSLNVEDGMTYELSALAKSDVADGATLVLGVRTANGTYTTQEHKISTVSTKYSFEMMVEDGSETAEISVAVKNNNETAWIDNVNFFTK